MPHLEHEFCLYEALEITKDATQQDVVTSYRRLARIHHPDKNPDDPEATGKFQKIQAAHEILSDPGKRSRYDHAVASPQNVRGGRHPFYDEGSDSDSDAYYDYEDDFLYSFFSRFVFREGMRGHGGGMPGYSSNGAGGGRGYERPQNYEQQEAMFAEMEAREEEYRKQYREEVAARYEAEEQAKKAKIAAKKEQEDAEKRALAQQQADEKHKQQVRWKEAEATTVSEKQDICLHSQFWPKITQKRKFKCGGCFKKSGMTSFQCPHCSLLVCQTCNIKLRKQFEALDV